MNPWTQELTEQVFFLFSQAILRRKWTLFLTDMWIFENLCWKSDVRTHVCMCYTIATYITDFLFLPAKGEFLWGFLLRVVRFLYIHPFEARCEIWQTFSSVWRFNFVVVFHCNGCMYREKRIRVSLRQLVLFVFICNRLFILPYSESDLK